MSSSRILQAQKMVMMTMARASLRRNNHRFFCTTPPSTVAGITPRRLLSKFPAVLDSLPLDCLLRAKILSAKYGASKIPTTEGVRKKREFYDDDDDDDDDTPKTNGDDTDSDDPYGQCHYNPWSFKANDDVLYLMMDMPGVDKENVKVYIEGSTQILKVKGVRKTEPEFGDDAHISRPKSYVSGVSLMPIIEYKVDQIKAVMKDGVLKVTIPKVKDEERMDLLHVQVD